MEGFLAHFVADNSLARAMESVEKVPLNTDDRTVLEFAFARSKDQRDGFRIGQLRSGAKVSGADRLPLFNGEVDWNQVDQARISMLVPFGDLAYSEDYADPVDRSRAEAYSSYVNGDLEAALELWREHPRQVRDLIDLQMVAECLADDRKTEALGYIEKLRVFAPTEADAILAHFLLQEGQFDQATDALERAFHRLRSDPWPSRELTERTLTVARSVAQHSKSDLIAQRLYQALKVPFSVFNGEEQRRIVWLEIGMLLDKGHYGEYSLPALAAAEPNVPWQERFLKARKACYENLGSPRAAQADRDWKQFVAEQPARLGNIAFLKEIPAEEKPQIGYGLER